MVPVSDMDGARGRGSGGPPCMELCCLACSSAMRRSRTAGSSSDGRPEGRACGGGGGGAVVASPPCVPASVALMLRSIASLCMAAAGPCCWPNDAPSSPALAPPRVDWSKCMAWGLRGCAPGRGLAPDRLPVLARLCGENSSGRLGVPPRPRFWRPSAASASARAAGSTAAASAGASAAAAAPPPPSRTCCSMMSAWTASMSSFGASDGTAPSAGAARGGADVAPAPALGAAGAAEAVAVAGADVPAAAAAEVSAASERAAPAPAAERWGEAWPLAAA